MLTDTQRLRVSQITASVVASEMKAGRLSSISPSAIALTSIRMVLIEDQVIDIVAKDPTLLSGDIDQAAHRLKPLVGEGASVATAGLHGAKNEPGFVPPAPIHSSGTTMTDEEKIRQAFQ